ncbi:alpha/beta hydrolase [Rhizobium sp. BK456]|uniref:alpha/beta hydrolase n=1 Tax=Rhizobium sp. BK456 TaxID=2587007 RepID=UPI001615FD5E|nr:alpha/beta hydrolase fold domain-containing protein [Rhizobium sp. BK456]MBB3527075.1 acetyl esterase/lipase [Rhizobium sp. BK456]
MILDALNDIGISPADLVAAQRLNSVLAAIPRFHTSRRWNARLVNAALRLHRAMPDLRRWRSKVCVTPIPGTSCSLRLTHPVAPRRAMLLHFHGGAWVMGSARLEDRLAADIAGECGMLVAAVDFPNAVDDDLDRTLQECIATTAWVIDNLETFSVDCIFLSGESSGAHLALESLLSLRSTGRHSVVHGFYAVCGAFDLEGTTSLRDSPGSALLINGPSALENLHRLSASLPVHLRRGPLHAVLQGLPPALFIAGELDPIVDDSIEMHAKWCNVDGRAWLAVVPDGPHGFNRMPTRLASMTNAFGRRWLSERLRESSDD